jgi:hypothetical protein
MSDIYLQITETPTVVTLSAPVISGALSSTVTVANTVTVALDANSLSALENVTVTVGAAITGTVTVSNFPASQAVTFSSVSISNLPATQAVSLASVPTHGVTLTSTTVTVSSLPAISGTVTATLPSISGVVGTDEPIPPQGIQLGYNASGEFLGVSPTNRLPIDAGGTVVGGRASVGGTIFPLPVNQNGDAAGNIGIPIGFTYDGDFSNVADNRPLPISGAVTIGNSVTIGSLPAISGTVTANTFALQGTAVTTSNFTSTTASTVLASFNATREVLTIFNEGAGNLHIAPGATCTTIAYQVRLSAGDYYEVPNHQTTITHSAVFATAGTARVTEVS